MESFVLPDDRIPSHQLRLPLVLLQSSKLQDEAQGRWQDKDAVAQGV